jgi:hypothetical protein
MGESFAVPFKVLVAENTIGEICCSFSAEFV